MLSEAARAFACDGVRLEPALQAVIKRMAELLGGTCRLTFVTGDGRALRPLNPGSSDADGLLAVDGPSLEAEVARTGELRLALEPPLAIVPMTIDEKVIGTLSMSGAPGSRGYTSTDQAFLQAIADIAALALGSLHRREQIEQELERASRLKDEFLATISHELRTPLNAVLGWVHLLRGSAADPGIFERAVDTIERNALAQARLVSDLLDVSSIVAGRLCLEPAAVDLGTIVYEVVESLRSTAEAKRTLLDFELDPAAGQVRGDPRRLRQAAWSLISNALKFTPRGGRVHVSVAPAGSDIVVSVEDNGPGIPADFLGHVFDGFRQADGSPSRQQGGLGLGLALTRHLVELHGGSISVQSSTQGATFTVRLPGIGPTEGTGLAANVPETLVHLDGVRILLVDDDVDVQENLGTVLRKRGAIVEAVPTVRAALAAVRERLPDAMVADIGLPDEDGYALIARIRALPAREGGAIPALALTAYARTEDRIRALVAGYQMHVPKPANPVEVGVAVARLLRSHAGVS
jgi:signal transduction histidine kinase/ActR/RegA family two-component response regulator